MTNLKNIYRNYTPDEVFHVLQEDCRLRSFVDTEVDDGEKITKSMIISEWQLSLDLLPCKKLYGLVNALFGMDIQEDSWVEVVMPEKEKTIWDICKFVSQYSMKEIVQPINIFGRDCLGVAVFLTLKKNFLRQGINVNNIRPSSYLKDFIDVNNFPSVMVEISKMGVKTFEFVRVKLREDISFGKKINIFGQNRYCLDTGSIKTFGDLSKRIAEQLGNLDETN